MHQIAFSNGSMQLDGSSEECDSDTVQWKILVRQNFGEFGKTNVHDTPIFYSAKFKILQSSYVYVKCLSYCKSTCLGVCKHPSKNLATVSEHVEFKLRLELDLSTTCHLFVDPIILIHC